MNLDERPNVDAKAFCEPLWKLADTVAEKVRREGKAYVAAPDFVFDDISIMIRQAIATYNFLFYVNADERVKDDCLWNFQYGILSFQLVRSVIDALYNITCILQSPAENGRLYRRAGLNKRVRELDADEKRYAGQPDWLEFIKKQRDVLSDLIRASGFSDEAEVKGAKWATLGSFVMYGHIPPEQEFLRSFTYGRWRQYSSFSHCGYEGYISDNPPLGIYFMKDLLPHEMRPQIEKTFPKLLTKHIGLLATALLCISTEIQAYFRFDGANINDRICAMWRVLLPIYETKELYEQRYQKLMDEKRISPDWRIGDVVFGFLTSGKSLGRWL